jgi:transposase-like protein
MFDSGNEQALINCCAVDHKVFAELLELFEPVFNTYTIDHKTGLVKKLNTRIKGRPRKIDAVGVLGLVLFWYRTRGSAARSISLAFGLTASNLYGWLRFGRRALLYALQHHPDAKVTPPTKADIDRYVEAIANQYPLLAEERVWAACDGLKLPLEQSSNWLKQNPFYNGWKSHTYVNSVFCFAPDGLIRCATINCPGSWHDSTQADYGLYQKLENIYNLYGGKVVVDSAFGLQSRDFLIRSAQQQDPSRAGATTPEAKKAIQLNKQATSLRQISEHGMRMIQGQFPRLKDNFKFEEFGERKIVLHLMVLLYNYQAAKVGINQILNSFMSKTNGFYSYSISEDANNEFL